MAAHSGGGGGSPSGRGTLVLAGAAAAGGALATAALYVYRRELACWLYDFVDQLRPLPPATRVYLSPEHNWAPVLHELQGSPVDVVEGQVPSDLRGAYLRTGPNPMLPVKGSYHWFDGDGMVHALLFNTGPPAGGGGGGSKAGVVVRYSNHAVRTTRLRQNLRAGRELFMQAVGQLRGPLAVVLLGLSALKDWVGVGDLSEGHGTANTGMVVHGGRVMALHEDDLPYQVLLRADGQLETVGRVRLSGPEEVGAYAGVFTAHPKVDPLTGECFFFGYDMMDKPWMRAGLLDAQGQLTKQWVVDLPYPASVHDCGLTQHYGVLMLHPLVFDPKNLFKREGTGMPVVWAPHLPARVGLLRRDAPGCPPHLAQAGARRKGTKKAEAEVEAPFPWAPVQWFDLPTSFVFHVANCWEDEQGLVHVVVCQYGRMDFRMDLPPPEADDWPLLHRYVLDPASGRTLAVEKLSEVCVEFPVVHPGWVGRRGARWTWGALLNDPAHQQPPRHLGKPLGAPQQSAMASLAAACSLVEELARAMDGAGPGAPGPATSPDALLQLLLEPTLVHPATDAEAARSVSSGLAMVVAARLHVTRQVASGSAVSLEGQLGALADVVHAHKPKSAAVLRLQQHPGAAPPTQLPEAQRLLLAARSIAQELADALNRVDPRPDPPAHADALLRQGLNTLVLSHDAAAADGETVCRELARAAASLLASHLTLGGDGEADRGAEAARLLDVHRRRAQARYDPTALGEGGGLPDEVGVGLGKFDVRAPALQQPGQGDGALSASGDACVARLRLPLGCLCLEPIFAPRSPPQHLTPEGEQEEDDGYLLAHVYDTVTGRSELHVYDARTLDPKPLARLRMPQRVPNGLHGVWVTEAQLAAQRTAL